MSRAYGELRSQGLIRTGLVLLAIPSGIIAIWGLLAYGGHRAADRAAKARAAR